MKIKRWYIWIWIPFITLPVLWLIAGARINEYERKHDIGFFDGKSLRSDAVLRFLLLGIVVGFPVLIVHVVTENDQIANAYFYFAGVFLTYRYIRWYEKNVLPLLKEPDSE